MESGKHRISLKMIKGKGNGLQHYFGLVRDGAAWDKFHGLRESTDAWYMENFGSLYGNGKDCDDNAGDINEGQIVSMEVDFDKGTLRLTSGSMASPTVLVTAVWLVGCAGLCVCATKAQLFRLCQHQSCEHSEQF